MSLALHAEKNAKANYKILALKQSSGALATYALHDRSLKFNLAVCALTSVNLFA